MPNTGFTDYQAKYLAYELTRRHASDSDEKFAGTLVDAQVDANPHQIDAALFAFKSPLATGALLADEVGLGKTIEAGLVISQKWAERKRRILIIVPASLRKQWSLEMAEKFFVPCTILETKSYNQAQRSGRLTPFQSDRIIICSYEFARRKASDIANIPWDLVVLDEAHRLRNVYKGNLTALLIKQALQRAPKLLLTATPLQNSLNELYGLVSMIDEYTFGDFESFRAQFGTLQTEADFARLRQRIRPICHRTLRKQVLPYIKYTKRQPLLEEFESSASEDRLYDAVSEYLRRDQLKSLPNSQRALITMVLRKLLSSSTFAIASALEKMAGRLRTQLGEQTAPDLGSAIAEDYETYDEVQEEDEDEDVAIRATLSESDRQAIAAELRDLDEFIRLARSIEDNAKGKALLVGLRRAFQQAERLGAARKAIIFTESRKTQDYIKRLLLSTPEFATGIVLFNGSNSDEDSKRIYETWVKRHKGTDRVTGSRSADMRAALVDAFRDDAQIMIATESAAEGINLQFCSLVVNYDLPWNPQRIEQRIGRCHRYGQKHDVVVLNFLNQKNEADKRVYELLAEKFNLFQGVFGASDEVLGSISETGVSFEKRISDIYQKCRSQEQINQAFVQLQMDLSETIKEEVTRSRQILLENFDDEVAEKLKLIEHSSGEQITLYEQRLMAVTRHELAGLADFADDAFVLRNTPFGRHDIHTGRYELPRRTGDAYLYRLGHPLAEAVLARAKERDLRETELIFDLTAHRGRVAALEPYRGATGWLVARSVTVTGPTDAEDWLVLAAVTDDGRTVDKDAAPRLFQIPGRIGNPSAFAWDEANATVGRVKRVLRERDQEIIDRALARNSRFLDEESEKLERWADDRKQTLRLEMKEIDKSIKELKREEKLAGSMPEKIAFKRKIQQERSRQDEAEMNFRAASRDVEQRQTELLDQVERRLLQNSDNHDLFRVRWSMV